MKSVVDLQALNVNTSAAGSVSESKVEATKVAQGGEGKGCCILSSTECTWLLNTSHTPIVTYVSCHCVLPSIPLIDVQVNKELITVAILTTFSKIDADIDRYFSGIDESNVLCEEPVFL